MVTKIQNNVGSEKVASVNVNLVGATKRDSPPPTAVADAVGGGGTARLNTVAEASLAVGENPFVTVAASALSVDAKTLRLTDSADATSESIEPSLELMSLVSGLEAKLTTRGVWSAERLRTGMMQATYDAQEERMARTGVDREGTETLAKYLMDRPVSSGAKPVIHANEWQAQVGTYFKGGDVNAFVQSVLRESYLLGNLDLQMYGDRVKALNEMKKKIREEADRARKIKAEWAALAKGDENWVSPTAFETVKVDNAQMALISGPYAEVDGLESATGQLQAGSDEGASANDSGFFAAGSALGTDEALLESIMFYDADAIQKGYLKDLADKIPKMNAYDLQTYLLPILHGLLDAEHQGSIVQLFRSMSDEQVMMAVADGISPENMHDLHGKEFGELTARIRKAEMVLMPNAKHEQGTVVTQQEASAVWSAYQAKTNPAKREDNGSLTNVSHKQGAARSRYGDARMAPSETHAAQTVATAESAAATTPSTVDTVEKMDAYVKYLEEQMNSVGDDAQLANVDLQNCLQKQQQTMQMMSNISKMLHDVAMSIIRNMNS